MSTHLEIAVGKEKYIVKNVKPSMHSKPVCAYIEDTDVVYDKISLNFHVFPCDEKTCDVLSNEISLLRRAVINNKVLKNKLNIVKTSSEFKKLIIEKDHKYLLEGYGSRPKKRYRYLYKFATIYCNNAYYSINFMRYICEENVIGCTMRAIQFHKDNGKVNAGGVCYPQTDKDFDFNINDNGHICYNPPVEWPTAGSSCNDQILEIIGRFLDFVDNNEKEGKSFYKNPERNKKGFGKDYLQKT